MFAALLRCNKGPSLSLQIFSDINHYRSSIAITAMVNEEDFRQARAQLEAQAVHQSGLQYEESVRHAFTG